MRAIGPAAWSDLAQEILGGGDPGGNTGERTGERRLQ